MKKRSVIRRSGIGRPLAYLGFFLVFGLLSFRLVLDSASPETQIIGKWREVSWKYELVDASTQDSVTDKMITDDAREQIARELIIHEAETWEFRKNGELLLHRKNQKPTKLSWTLKGRGHVLQIGHGKEKTTEFYDLAEINKKKLVLYVDVEIQAKGIVRMSFEKIT